MRLTRQSTTGLQTQVGKVAQALTNLDGVQLAEDLVGVGPKQQPSLKVAGSPSAALPTA
jgi:hypothetical protein